MNKDHFVHYRESPKELAAIRSFAKRHRLANDSIARRKLDKTALQINAIIFGESLEIEGCYEDVYTFIDDIPKESLVEFRLWVLKLIPKNELDRMLRLNNRQHKDEY